MILCSKRVSLEIPVALLDDQTTKCGVRAMFKNANLIVFFSLERFEHCLGDSWAHAGRFPFKTLSNKRETCHNAKRSSSTIQLHLILSGDNIFRE